MTTACMLFLSINASASDGLTPKMVDSINAAQADYEDNGSSAGQNGLIAHLYSSQLSSCDDCGQAAASCGCESACETGYCAPASGGPREAGILARIREKKCCNDPWWAHRTGGFGEFLYLSPGSSDLIHAIEVTDPNPANATPTGPVGIVDMTAQPGFRAGFTLAASHCSSLTVAYTRWDGDGSDVLRAGGANVLDSQLLHPSLLTSGATSLEAVAQHDMSFQLLDVNYRHLWKQTDRMAINWIGGLRYGKMEQDFTGSQTVQAATGLTTVQTDIDFEGFGINGGLDLERYSQKTGIFIYGRGMASLMAGDWKASYRQTNENVGGGEPANNYQDFHATPVLEGELGLGWMRPCGRIRLQAGYMMSAWYESVSTRGYIEAVRDANLVDIGETITFSGLTTRLSILF